MNLLPCPFCGGEAAHATCTITRDRDIHGNKGTFTGHYVNCIMCGADNRGIAEGHRTPEQAAEKWNRRIGPDGWKLVPSEPTADMKDYGARFIVSKPYEYEQDWAAQIYRAMLAAAPTCELSQSNNKE